MTASGTLTRRRHPHMMDATQNNLSERVIARGDAERCEPYLASGAGPGTLRRRIPVMPSPHRPSPRLAALIASITIAAPLSAPLPARAQSVA